MSDPPRSAAELPDEVREDLRRHVLTLADSKRILGIRYSDWLLGSPSIEAGITSSAMAQDEWGHARLLYAMLKDFGEDPVAVEHERDAEAYTSVDALDEPFPDWAAVIAAVVIVDGALTAALEGFAAGDYEAARSRIGKMVSEEVFHRDFGAAWFRRLSGGTDEARERLRGHAEAMLPRTLAWLDPGDEASARLSDAGLTGTGTGVRERFAAGAGSLLGLVGIDLGTIESEREGWSGDRRRGPGSPGLEAVERARGDLNRALFVE